MEEFEVVEMMVGGVGVVARWWWWWLKLLWGEWEREWEWTHR